MLPAAANLFAANGSPSSHQTNVWIDFLSHSSSPPQLLLPTLPNAAPMEFKTTLAAVAAA
jgi:hypothetical protein